MIPFQVSKTFLTFNKALQSSQTFNINWNAGQRDLELLVVHNLPYCFKIEQSSIQSEENQVSITTPFTALINTPCSLKVTYDPTRAEITYFGMELWNELDQLEMRISDSENLHNPVIVTVDFEDSEQKRKLFPVEFLGFQSLIPTAPSRDIFDCKVCLHSYSDDDEELTPRILTGCGHTLCQKCAKTIQGMSENRQSLLCPFDRKITQGTIENFPKNFAIIDMIREQNGKEIEAKLGTTDICEDPYVECFENSKHEATRYCKICEVDFCDNCFLTVHSSKVLSSHESILVEDKPFALPNCIIHPGQMAKFLCKEPNCTEENKEFCEECLNQGHESHKTELILEIVEQNEEKMSRIVQKLELSISGAARNLQRTDRLFQKFSKTGNGYKCAVDTVNRHFEEEKAMALICLDSIMDSKKEKLEKGKDQMEVDLMSMIETKKKMEKKLRNKSTLFAEKVIEEGQVMCSLNRENFTSLTFPTLHEILKGCSSSSSSFSSLSSNDNQSSSESWILPFRTTSSPPSPKQSDFQELSIFFE